MNGWAALANYEHSQGPIDRPYAGCDADECHLLCDDLYGDAATGGQLNNAGSRGRCNTGCSLMANMVGAAGPARARRNEPGAVPVQQQAPTAKATVFIRGRPVSL